MNIRLILLRIAYWIAALGDAYFSVRMLMLPYSPGVIFRSEMESVASLMIGWTALLIWADRKPVQRRFVLLLTIMIMALGRIIDAAAIFTGKVSLDGVLSKGLLMVLGLSFFILVYLLSAKLTETNVNRSSLSG
jgi:hypothetical protein